MFFLRVFNTTRQEITKRHAIIEALRADRTAKEITDFFNYNKDLVYRIKKQFEACDDPETFTGERKIHKRRSESIRSPEFVTKVAPLNVMPPYFFPNGLRVAANNYIKVLETVVKPWMVGVAGERPYVFQKDSAPAHMARTTQAWLYQLLIPFGAPAHRWLNISFVNSIAAFNIEVLSLLVNIDLFNFIWQHTIRFD